MSACSSGGEVSDSGSRASGPVSLDFWGWAPGYDKSVALWNKTHPNVKVKFSKVPSGLSGGYTKMQAAVKAGNAPCLAQVGYESLSTFVTTGALEDISSYANTDKDQFVEWAWKQSGLGGKVFGIPVDTGPTALFYRKDLFAKYHLPAPKTWQDFSAAAEKFHAADPENYLINAPMDSYEMAVYTWQSGGHWFGTANDQWQVKIDGPQTQKVSQYWQGLLDKKVLKTGVAPLDGAWFKEAKADHMASVVTAAWAAPMFEQMLPKQSGKWAVAPMPQWNAGEQAAGNNGGSSTAVLKGCKHLKQATEFATWFSTNKDSVSNLIKNTGIYPAAKSGMDLPAVNQKSPYFGGQNIYQVFKAGAENTDPNWVWGPTMSQVEPDFIDELKKVAQGKASMSDAAEAVQSKTVKAMKSQGLSVG
ncbi:sugar ABC transporter substrate-binding protein [Streptomyces antnestii]|uniref:Sugar ABC transporter substrate-binding protein n=2 Tax=Streptomyces antnestii TaxID=2494256 RepID=A0A437PFV1_9ACTN|nr:sugar ABC transporter substrate-binding protein [Streptomyces sp. San01]